MDNHDYNSLIQYYGREKLYHSMQNCALDALSKYPGESTFRLYNGIALVLGSRVQEGIRELNHIQGERDFSMASVIALMYAHKRCSVIDKEALIALDGRLKEERKRLTSNSAFYAAIFLFHTGKLEKSREYAERSLKLNPDNLNSLVLKGWSELGINSRLNRTTLECFDRALSAGGKNIDANLGQVRYHQLNNDFEAAISVLNQLSIRYPELNIPLVEKMKTQLSNWNWEHAVETSFRILNLEPTNIEAMRVKILVVLCRDGNYSSGGILLQKLFTFVEKYEPNNSELFLQIGQVFARVCGRHSIVIAETFKFIERASQLSPSNADYITEMGYQSIYLGRYKEATKYFRTATKLDDSSMYALCGLTLCQMAETGGASEQVNQQIEFLTEIQGADKIPLLMLMSSKVLVDDTDKAIALLIEASEIQFKNLKTLSYGIEYLRQFDPDFLLQISNQLLHYSPVQSVVTVGTTMTKETLHITLKHTLNILEMVVKACPGLVQGVYQLAKVQFLSGEIIGASATLQKILHELDPTCTEAHLLIAQIYIQQNSFQRAGQSLEVCLSHNFKVREYPMYFLLQGIIQKNNQQFDESLKSFLTAVSLSNNNNGSGGAESRNYNNDVEKLCLADKVTLYLELIDSYNSMEQSSEANKWMSIAIDEFRRTPEEGRLIVANADLLLQHGNLTKCLELLRGIDPGQPYYLQAKTKMAHVYLHHRKDRLGFAQCFKELVENCPGPESYLMLGDAFMSIQEPDQAIDAYKQALKQNPHDPLLASKLGRAYVKTHQYMKAINYYTDAINSPENYSLKLDLAELYLKLKQFKNAEETLMEQIEAEKMETEDLTLLQSRTKELLLLARVREKSGNIAASLETLKEARDNQYRIKKRINLDQTGPIDEQQRILSKFVFFFFSIFSVFF